jgi:hypothetical protein
MRHRPGSDTDEVSAAVQRAAQRALSGDRRLEIAMEMSLVARRLAESRIRSEHPDWSSTQVARELLRLAFHPAAIPPGYR